MEDEYTETFTFSYIDEDGFEVTTTFNGTYLSDVLAKFKRFVTAVGFTYVEEIRAVCGDVVHSSEDN